MKSLVKFAFALALGALVAAPAQAAKVPPGSYLQSCRNVMVDNSSGKPKVFAECPDHLGNWRHSGVQFMKCPGDIANQDGNLACANQGATGAGPNVAGPNGAGLPGGSWQQSCRNPQINGTMLTATCLRGSGGSSFSSIDTRACSGGPVGNQNGQLFCEGAAGQAGNQGGGNAPTGGGGQGTAGGGQDNSGGQGTSGGGQDNSGGQGTAGGGQDNSGGQGTAGGTSANTNAGGAGLPAGSWQRSCRNPHLSESVLTANCQRLDGAYHYSALDLASCDGGPVGNDNGRLVCETAGQAGGNAAPVNAAPGNAAPGNADAGGGAALPSGSWQQSCDNPRMNGSVLTASCRRSDGGSRFSALDVGSCPGGRVGNFEGSLACE